MVAAHLREHLQLAVLVQLADLRILEEMQQLLVLRHRVIDLVDEVLRLLGVARLPGLLRRLD